MIAPKKTVLVVGASSGIGAAVAAYFHQKNWRVLATSRHPSGFKSTSDFTWLPLDVTDSSSVKNLVTYLLDQNIVPDVLVNVAGVGYHGPLEIFSDTDLASQFEVNLFGIFRIIRSILPLMRSRHTGRIINISSVMAVAPAPFLGIYSASKSALESLSTTLRYELSLQGIPVSYIEPGFVNTPFGSHVITPQNWHHYQSIKENFETNYHLQRSRLSSPLLKSLTSPERVAVVVYKAAVVRSPHLRYVVGCENRLYLFLRSLLPVNLQSFIFSLVYPGLRSLKSSGSEKEK
ncbi:MAG TPA: SDR family oxidoreductase [Patescibacteria group bacterium]